MTLLFNAIQEYLADNHEGWLVRESRYSRYSMHAWYVELNGYRHAPYVYIDGYRQIITAYTAIDNCVYDCRYTNMTVLQCITDAINALSESGYPRSKCI